MGHWASNGRSKSMSGMSFSIGDSSGEDNGVDDEATPSDEGTWKSLEAGDVSVEA